jgi:tRNA threonylcarbamoyl adenosine modification protein YjeE
MNAKREQIETASAEETQALAARLEGELPDGAVLCLHGELGAGKTCFVQGLARALGVRRPVGSPTFTLINEYRGKRGLAHIDLYRLRGAADAFGLGVEEYLEHFDGIVGDRVGRAPGRAAAGGVLACEAGNRCVRRESRTVTVERPAAG